MGAVIGELLPLAVGVAISPIPVIGAILMLLGKRARTTSIGFAFGWLFGIIVATTIFVIVGGAFGGGSAANAWIKIGAGALLLGVGLRQWRSRDAAAGRPKWMGAIDEMKVPAATALGFALAAINPKNLLMCIGAGVAIGGAELDTASDVIVVAVFSVLAATTVVIPVLAYQLAADRLRVPLDRLKSWLEANNATVMATLILVIAALLIGKGLAALTA